ncbi:MAG: hypothetical protein CL920_33615 [Deltaproteobacteria bacterium]|nr:hypothetical protein [Deltaproteobacteria bacterium]MBU53663.1 hypothetical protein [Deltaproteobacteria bacterium]
MTVFRYQKMFFLSMFAFSLMMMQVGCGDNVINHNDGGNPDQTGIACKNDCECQAKDAGVCQNNLCNDEIKRASQCPDCNGSVCPAGEVCYDATSKKLGTCQAANTCKDDCDCAASGKVCESGTCQALRRATLCPDCNSTSCPKGDRCYDATTQTVGTCSGSIACKNDCECLAKNAGVCQNGVCDATIKRANLCPDCNGQTCPAGEACYDATTKTVGTCSSSIACKNDCECLAKNAGVCQNGVCDATIKRANMCPDCNGSVCPAGDVCFDTKAKTIGTCPAATTCKDDCDCDAAGAGVCEGGSCTTLVNRVSNCPSCTDPTCKDGTRCFDASTKKVGTCGPESCKNDCDCMKNGGVCEGGLCNKLVARASMCPDCNGKSCPAGDACYDSTTQQVSTCLACKDDCDCMGRGLLCASGTCLPLRRMSMCPDCNSTSCTKGDRCYDSSTKKPGVCSGVITCKDDCDCLVAGFGVCANNTCQPLKRMTLCPSCNSSTCPSGDRCYEAMTNTVGTCKSSSSCKDDCDCMSKGLLCDSGTCRALQRPSFCQFCSSSTCTTGQRCYDATNKQPGICGSKTCTDDCDCIGTGTACISGQCVPAGRKNQCTCNRANCPAGTKCELSTTGKVRTCPSSGTFACGEVADCTKGTQYCETGIGGANPCGGGSPTPPQCGANCTVMNCSNGNYACMCRSFQCKALPTNCQGCSCLGASGACSCQTVDGNPVVTCAFP